MNHSVRYRTGDDIRPLQSDVQLLDSSGVVRLSGGNLRPTHFLYLLVGPLAKLFFKKSDSRSVTG